MVVTTYDIALDVLASLAICLDVLVVFTILRHEKLRRVPNVFVANWALSDILVLVGVHANERLIDFLEEEGISAILVALVRNSEHVFHSITLVSAAATAVDWHIAAYSEEALESFRKCHIVVILPWVLGMLYLVDFLVLSSNGLYTLPVLMFFCLYMLGFILVVYVNAVRMKKKCRNEPYIQPGGMLAVSSLVVMAWLPIWVCLLLVHAFELASDVRIVTEVCYLSTSVITFVGMLLWNPKFRASFCLMFKCGKKDEPAPQVQLPPMTPEEALAQLGRYAEYSV